MLAADVPDGPLLLDTDVFSWLVWQRANWQAFADLVDGHPFVLSFAVVGELRAGAVKAQWSAARRELLNRRIAECVVLTADDVVVTAYAELHARFRDNLRKDGANDMWTAACALAHDPALPIVTNNLNDFELMAASFPLRLVHPDR